MKEVVIVLELMNNFVLGVYTSELNAIDGILKNCEEYEEEDPGYKLEDNLDYDISKEFKMFVIPLDHVIELSAYASDSKTEDYMRAGYELPQKTYRDMIARRRELAISEVVD